MAAGLGFAAWPACRDGGKDHVESKRHNCVRTSLPTVLALTMIVVVAAGLRARDGMQSHEAWRVRASAGAPRDDCEAAPELDVCSQVSIAPSFPVPK